MCFLVLLGFGVLGASLKLLTVTKSEASKTTLLDILVSRRCYTEKEHRFTRKILCNISAFHLRNICAKNIQ